MIILQGVEPMAHGLFRACYPHPDQQDKCVKIALKDHPLPKRAKLIDLKEPTDPNLRELFAYKKLKARGVPVESRFPAVHDLVDTDLGQGLLVDRIDAALPEGALTLRDYIEKGVRGELTPDRLMAELRSFADFCVRHSVFASCDEWHNLYFVRKGADYHCMAFDLKLRLNREFIPFSSVFPFALRHKIRRRFNRMIAEVEGLLSAPQSA